MEPPPQEQSFFFVDNLQSDKKALRSFVTRRRNDHAWRRRHLLPSRAPLGWSNAPQSSSSQNGCNISSHRLFAGSRASFQTTSSETFEDLQISRQRRGSSSSSDELAAGSTSSLLSTIERDLINIDPFANLPMKLDGPSQSLYHVSTAFLTENTYSTTWTNAALVKENGLAANYNSQIRLCLSLAATSGYLDSMNGSDQGPSPRTLWWRVASVQCLNRLLEDPATRYGDEVLSGIATLLLFEALNPASQQRHVHSRAMMQLLSNRESCGGLPLEVDHVNISLLITTLKAQTAYLDHPQPALPDIDVAAGWKKEVASFVTTLKSLSSWVHYAQHAFRAAKVTSNVPLSLWRDVLRSPVDEFESSNQIFVLCYLALSIREIGDAPTCVQFFRLLATRLQRLGPNQELQNAVWLCVKGLESCYNYKREAIRLVRVFHRLSESTQIKVKSFLFGICRIVTSPLPAIQLSQGDYLAIIQEALEGVS